MQQPPSKPIRRRAVPAIASRVSQRSANWERQLTPSLLLGIFLATCSRRPRKRQRELGRRQSIGPPWGLRALWHEESSPGCSARAAAAVEGGAVKAGGMRAARGRRAGSWASGMQLFGMKQVARNLWVWAGGSQKELPERAD
jgi:hypothetical protein